MRTHDADFIRACEEHRAATAALRAAASALDYPECAAARRYIAAFDAVNEAPSPTTMEGVTALAASALAEARNRLDGGEDWENTAASWAGDVVESLLHLQGVEP